ncbi:AAA family ATPase [Candidatus Woesearchaeota archaeon]|nr:AAA family ATPase [Candidatus Woesearchaeota archaeon]
MKKSIYVFLMGTPGCGKSTLYKILEKKIKEKIDSRINGVLKLDDFQKLMNIFLEDERTKKWENCKKTDEGYILTNLEILDKILKELNKDIKKESKPGRILFIEFARPDIVRSISENFSHEVKKDSIIVYINTSFGICLERNMARRETAIVNEDRHFVPEEQMELLYRRNDLNNLQELKIPHIIIKNDKGIKELEQEAESLIEKIKHLTLYNK